MGKAVVIPEGFIQAGDVYPCKHCKMKIVLRNNRQWYALDKNPKAYTRQRCHRAPYRIGSRYWVRTHAPRVLIIEEEHDEDMRYLLSEKLIREA